MEDGWQEWSKYVLKELERLNKCYDSLNNKIDTLSMEITMLKVKSGIWGAIAGCVPVAITLAILFISKTI